MDYQPHKNDVRVQMLIWLTKAPYLLWVYLKQKFKQKGVKSTGIKY